jgi:GNAT superfamily N-acetyltransferase
MADAFEVRLAEPRDHPVFARFFLELDIHQPTPEPERWTAEMMPHTFFLESRGTPVGYALVEVFGELGYVRHVVVDSAWRGRGVGRALMDAIAERVSARGCTRWKLNVKRDNVPAIRLYERVGMNVVYSSSVVRLDWSAVEVLPRDGFALEAVAVQAADDATVERAFDLPDGQIGQFRATGGQVLMQLRDADGAIGGFARFDPGFPGAFPFRVKSSRFLHALLDALRPHARPGDAWLQLVIEDDAESAEIVLGAGARLVFEILNMEGALPSGLASE